MAQQTTRKLTATYESSQQSQPFSLTTELPSPATTSVADKTQYLAALRHSITAMQSTINKELTTRMEEDKARDASTTVKAGSVTVDEVNEEENYGEEVQEDDD